MMRLASFAILVAVACIVAPSRAADEKSYVLRFKELGVGEPGSYAVTHKGETFVQEMNAQNIVVYDFKYKCDTKLAFWTRDEGKGRILRGYGEARATIDGNKEVLPIEGKRLTIDWKGKGFTYKIDGVKDVPAKFHDILDFECREEHTVSSCLPDRAVKLKESWRFDASPLARGFAQHSKTLEYDVKNVQGLAQLLEVYEKDGRRFGKIVQHIEIPVVAVMVDGKKKKLAKADKTVVQIHYDCCIDGSAHLGTMKVVDYLSTTTKEAEEGVNFTLKIVYKNERIVTFAEGVKKK